MVGQDPFRKSCFSEGKRQPKEYKYKYKIIPGDKWSKGKKEREEIETICWVWDYKEGYYGKSL